MARRRQEERDAVVGLDIGSTKVAAVVAEADGDHVGIIGVGVARNGGLRKGVVVDIDGTARAVAAAAQQAQRMSGCNIAGVVIGVSGSHILSLNSPGVVAVGRADREITGDDVRRALEAAQVIPLTPDREVLHTIPREYEVDGYDGVKDPEGMVGARLEVQAHMVTAASASLQNLVRTVERGGLEVDDLWLAAMAAGEAVLTPEEKELGVILCDVGGGTMDICIYDKGQPWYSAVFPLGGEHVTSDIAVGLRVTLPVAEELKISRGAAAMAYAQNAAVELPNPSGRGTRTVSDELLAGIIEPRIRELVGFIGREIKRSNYPGILPGGLVLTGGTALLPGLTEVASEALDLPVRTGEPRGLAGMNDIVAAPGFSVAVGLVTLALRSGPVRELAAARERDVRRRSDGLWQRLRVWFENTF